MEDDYDLESDDYEDSEETSKKKKRKIIKKSTEAPVSVSDQEGEDGSSGSKYHEPSVNDSSDEYSSTSTVKDGGPEPDEGASNEE